jgi:membrane protease YdiL (CAAX protease family)
MSHATPSSRSATKQVLLFLAVLFGFTWPWGYYIARPLLASPDVSRFLAGLLPSVWAPTIVAVGLVSSSDGLVGLREELGARLRLRQGSARWLLLAGAAPIILTTAAMFGARAAGDAAPFIPPGAMLSAIGMQVITGAVGEELGWRGYLLPRLGRSLGRMWGAVVMASTWALWHLPAFFTPGMPHQFIPLLPFLVAVASFGVFLALVFEEAGNTVLTTIVAHLSLNIVLAIGGVDITSDSFWRTMAVAYGLAALVALVRLRRVDRRSAPRR